MIIKKLSKLKKYLFLISILFLFLSAIHLSYVYLYEDSETIPVEGGTISEGLIGNFPSLNPLVPLSGNNEYVVGLLYRSLLKYDVKQEKIVGDIVSCDIENISRIECFINDNAFWSNGERITADDIISTFKKIEETGSNIIISSLLENTEIQNQNDVIIFSNDQNDINVLNIFFQPILPQKMVENLTEEDVKSNFNKTDGIYSGDFVITNISSDATIGVSKINLDRNPYFNNGNIEKLVLNIFPDTSTFLKNSQSVNIFNDNENIIGNSNPRLGNHKYTVPQFIGLFINKENVSSYNLRSFILNEINSNNLVGLLGENNFEEVDNPYMNDMDITNTPNNRNFEEIMSSLGYNKKSSLIDGILDEENISTSTGSENNSSDLEGLTIDDFQEGTNTITSPNYVEKYNFVTQDDILLTGGVSSGVDEVIVNDYSLQGFTPGDNEFYYRLSEAYDSIQPGENNYKIYFVTDGERELVDDINFYYNSSQSAIEEYRNELVSELSEQRRLEESQNQEEENTQEEGSNSEQELLISYQNLDDSLYYNNDLEPFSLNLYFLNSQRDLEQTANFIRDSLKSLGINIELVPYNIQDIGGIIGDKSQYDMIITGINLGYFDFNIFPYMHSSQAESGYNFSNLKRTSLDLLLEELKSNIYGEERINEIQQSVSDILKEEQVVKTLYTPKINLLIDKNIKNTSFIDYIPNKALRSYIINEAYIREERNINLENKSTLGFFKFLFGKLYE